MAYLRMGSLNQEDAVLLLTKELIRRRRAKSTRGRVSWCMESSRWSPRPRRGHPCMGGGPSPYPHCSLPEGSQRSRMKTWRRG
jgi:hypothetical protein